jgi:hypothetical protein
MARAMPSADERAYREAAARKAEAEAMQMEMQQKAMEGAGGALADVFREHYTSSGQPVRPWAIPGTNEVVENTMPSVPLATPEQANTFRTTRMADLFGQVGKDNAAALQTGLATGQAFGTPDDMRRSMVLQGKNIEQNFSPTGAEGNRVAERNSALKIAEESANPPSQTPRNYITQDGKQSYTLDGRTDAATGAPIPYGAQIYTGEVSAANAGGLTPAAKTNAQEQAMSADEFQKQLDYFEQFIDQQPDSYFGTTGNVQRLAQNTIGQLSNLGIIKPNPAGMQETPDDAVQRTYMELAREAAQVGLDPEIAKGVFRPGLDTMGKIGAILTYSAGKAIANQSGNAFGSKDIALVQQFVPDPSSWWATKAGVKNTFGLLRDLVGIKKDTTNQALGTTPLAPLPGGAPAAASGAPAPGQIVNGYRFKGGELNNPASWELAQ